MYYRIKGLVLRAAAYRDFDLILTVLTENKGLLSVRAANVRKTNSTLKGACQLLTYSEFVIFENKSFLSVKEACCIEMFSELRNDLEKLSLASYFAQVAEVLSQDDGNLSPILPLCLNCMYALCRLEVSNLLVKAVFELRAMFLSGFMPQLDGCAQCGMPWPERFDVTNGRLLCKSCKGDGLKMPVSAGTLTAMRYLASCDGKKLFSFTLEMQSVQELADIAESYLASQLERGFSTLDFYKSLLI